MTELKPFSPTDADLRIEVEVQRDLKTLLVSFTVSGEIWDLRLPEKDIHPARHDELWKTTCFELFFAPSHIHGPYWEVNLSPSACWNSYAFKSYRNGMKEEAGLFVSSLDFKREDARIILTAKIDLSELMLGDQPLDVSAAAVIQDDEDHTSYWALRHCGQKEDFHLRESFTLKV